MNYPEWRALLQNETLPVAIVDLDAFDRNLSKLENYVRDGKQSLRLATKSIRVPALITRALRRGKSFRSLMCYSAMEAELLARDGLDDFLVAYPTLRKAELEALLKLHAAGKKVSLVVDSLENARAIADLASPEKPFRIVIEVDASLRAFGGLFHLGVRRSPIHTPAQLSELLRELGRTKSIQPVGMMVYEAQVAGLGDRNPFKRALNPLAALVRKFSRGAVARKRRALAEAFVATGRTLELFNGGGTGSLSYAAAESCLTELAAGSGLLCPHLFDYYSNLDLEPAAFFALQAVRRPDPNHITCQGGGYIASGEPGWDRAPLPWLPNGLKLIGTEGCGEVQTPLRVPVGTRIDLGAPILFRHAKSGELFERFNEVLLVSNGKIVERARTYRGCGQSFF